MGTEVHIIPKLGYADPMPSQADIDAALGRQAAEGLLEWTPGGWRILPLGKAIFAAESGEHDAQ